MTYKGYADKKARKKYLKEYMRRRRAKNKERTLTLKETVEDLRQIYDRPFPDVEEPKKLRTVVLPEDPTNNQMLAKGFKELILTTELHQRIMSVEAVNFEWLARIYQAYIRDMVMILFRRNFYEQHATLLHILIEMNHQVLTAIAFREKYYPDLFEKERQKWDALRKETKQTIATYAETLRTLTNRQRHNETATGLA